MDASHIGAAESRRLVLLFFPCAAMLPNVVVHFLYVPAGELGQLDVPYVGDAVQVNEPAVVFLRVLLYVGLVVQLEPDVHPRCNL